MQILIAAAGLTLIIYLVRYLMNKIVDKGIDAASNAYKRHKNVQEDDNSGNLSDRYLK